MNPILSALFANSITCGIEPTTRPVNCSLEEGAGRLVIVTGENASGKSVFRRALTTHSRRQGVKVMSFSPEQKAQGGIVGAFVYGTEEYQSTGSNSVRLILNAIKTSRNHDEDHIVIFDEPESGLSDDYAAGVGNELSEYASNLPPRVSLVAVISHSRPLLTPLSTAKPTHVSLGHHLSLSDWLKRPITPKPIRGLLEDDLHMFGEISRAQAEHSERKDRPNSAVSSLRGPSRVMGKVAVASTEGMPCR